MAQANRLTIYINGIRYPIKTVEEPAYVEGLAREIDTMVRDLMNNAATSLNEALVLTALSCMDSYKRAEKSADNLRAQFSGYVEDAAKSRLEAEELRRQVERMKRQPPARENA